MQSAGVVDLLDESGQVSGDVLEGPLVSEVHGLDLEGLDETPRLGVRLRPVRPAQPRFEAPEVGKRLERRAPLHAVAPTRRTDRPRTVVGDAPGCGRQST